MKKRIGNDIPIVWTLTDTEGNPYDLTGKEFSVCMKLEGMCVYIPMAYTFTENVISFTFCGKDQPGTGIYDIILREGDSEVTYDVQGAVELVPHSWDEDEGDIDIESDLATNGEVNVIEVVKVNGVALPVVNKAVDVEVPTQLAQLAGDDTHRTVTDAEKAAWNGKYDKPSGGIPASDLAAGVIPDVSGFITKSVDDLVNYYKKSETYSQAEVNSLIGGISQFHYEIYASTSAITDPATNVLYLIGPTGSGADKYEEYVYSGGSFVKIGDTSIDLSGYVTTSTLNTALADYTTTSDLNTLLAGYQPLIDSAHKLDYSLLDNTPTVPAAGIPSGGTSGQVLKKTSGTDYAVEWADESGGGGGSLPAGGTKGQTLVKQSATDGDAIWADAFVYGIISQTISWTGNNNDGWDKTGVSDVVWGYIPKSFVDMLVSMQCDVTFNTSTGYFEMKGLTDLTYQDMLESLNYGILGRNDRVQGSYSSGSNFRAILANTKKYADTSWSVAMSLGLGGNDYLEVIDASPASITNLRYFKWSGGAYDINATFPRLRVFKAISFQVVSAKTLKFPAIVTCEIFGLNANLTLAMSSHLSPASVAYMVTYAGTSNITITLHATAYAAAIADSAVQSALASKTNVTLASA